MSSTLPCSLNRGACRAVEQPAQEIGAQVRLAGSPLDRTRQCALHGAPQDNPRPSPVELLIAREGQAELYEPPVEERVAGLEPPRARGVVRDFEHERDETHAYGAVMVFTLGAGRRRGRGKPLLPPGGRWRAARRRGAGGGAYGLWRRNGWAP